MVDDYYTRGQYLLPFKTKKQILDQDNIIEIQFKKVTRESSDNATYPRTLKHTHTEREHESKHANTRVIKTKRLTSATMQKATPLPCSGWGGDDRRMIQSNQSCNNKTYTKHKHTNGRET